jgi:NADPH-dependent 2,4-dienoyl-CoA reductase/sulfur reductase-like enzyme
MAFEVLVVGAGPAGLAAAACAVQSGARVGLVDDNPDLGGQIWRGGAALAHGAEARRWLARTTLAEVRVLTGTRIVAPLEPGVLLAENRAEPAALRYERLVLAPGAREYFLPFPGWTLPGVTGAGGLQALVKGGLPIAGKRVVVAGSGPLLLAVAAYLRGEGARILLIAEQAPWRQVMGFGRHLLRDTAKAGQAARFGLVLRGVPFRTDSWVTRAEGDGRIARVTVRMGAGTWTTACDYLACGFGLTPNVELPALLGCAVVDGAVQVDAWQQTSMERVFCAGEATGIGGLDKSLVEGQIAGLAATGQRRQASTYLPERERTYRFAAALRRAFALRDELRSLPTADTIVCRCEDVRYHDIYQQAGWRSAKLQTRCGMGPCQGRVCGAALSFQLGWCRDSPRPPVTPVQIGSLAAVEALHHSPAGQDELAK